LNVRVFPVVILTINFLLSLGILFAFPWKIAPTWEIGTVVFSLLTGFSVLLVAYFLYHDYEDTKSSYDYLSSKLEKLEKTEKEKDSLAEKNYFYSEQERAVIASEMQKPIGRSPSSKQTDLKHSLKALTVHFKNSPQDKWEIKKSFEEIHEIRIDDPTIAELRVKGEANLLRHSYPLAGDTYRFEGSDNELIRVELVKELGEGTVNRSYLYHARLIECET